MTNYFNYNDPIRIQWRDALVDKENEQWKIVNNKFFLDEIPDEDAHVQIAGYSELYQRYSASTTTPASNQFIVNYQNGEVTFNPSENGKTVTVTKYKGRGIILYPAKRIYLETENPDFLKTLQSLVDETDAALEGATSLAGAIQKGEDLKKAIETDIGTATTLKDDLKIESATATTKKADLDGSITRSNQAKVDLDGSIKKGQDTKVAVDTSVATAEQSKTNLDASIKTGDQLKIDLEDDIAVGSKLHTDLQADISQGTTLKDTLEADIKTGSDTNEALKSSTTSGNTTKTNLDKSIATGTSTNTELKGTISTAGYSKTELEGVIQQSNTAKSALDGSNTTANNTKAELDKSITQGQSVNTELGGNIATGQNKIQEITTKIDEAQAATTAAKDATDTANDVSNRLDVFEAYSDKKVYYPLNKVYYSGSSYVCVAQTSAGTLPTDSNYWKVIAQAGSGSVSSVNGDSSGDIVALTPNTNVVLRLNTGTGANQIVKLDENGKVSADILKDGATNLTVSKEEKQQWSGKQNSLGYTPEDAAHKGQTNGYAGLDSNGKIPLAQLPDVSKQQTYVVVNAAERTALKDLIRGDKTFETETGDSYIWDGSKWLIMADADWANVSLDWANLNNKPNSSVAQIDSAVAASHTHSNKAILDATTAAFTNALESKLNAVAVDATKVTASTKNGNVIINGTETTVYAHPDTDGNKHVPASGTTNANKVLTATGEAGKYQWSEVSYTNVTNKPIYVGSAAPVNPPANMIWIQTA